MTESEPHPGGPVPEIAMLARITGRVQGVAFRAWTQAQAEALGLRGWVRNEPDGSVAALIIGPGARVDALVEKLHKGPRAARVEEVATIAGADDASRGFRIVP